MCMIQMVRRLINDDVFLLYIPTYIYQYVSGKHVSACVS